jgi:predicted DNA-binding transcriptional regulator AlpA
MTDIQSPPFMRLREIEKLHPVCDRTRVKAEHSGLFPKRFRLADKVPGWRRTEITDWLSDPAAWVSRKQSAGAGHQ